MNIKQYIPIELLPSGGCRPEAPGEVHTVRVGAAVPGVRAAVQEEDGPHAEAHLVIVTSW